MRSNSLKAAVLLMAAAATPSLFAQAPFVIVVSDPPGWGFNDPTPATPIGGNTGTTLGEQRLIAFKHAAAIWSSKLNSPAPIRVRAGFDSLACSANQATLGVTET